MRLLSALFAAATFAIVPFVQAQSVHENEEVIWQLAAKQVMLSLESEYDLVRTQTLKNVIVFSALYRDQIDLRPVVKPIAKIASDDVSAQNRSLALAALRAIDSIRARQYLAELQGIDENAYRRLVATVLSEYYSKPNAM